MTKFRVWEASYVIFSCFRLRLTLKCVGDFVSRLIAKCARCICSLLLVFILRPSGSTISPSSLVPLDKDTPGGEHLSKETLI